MNCSYFDLSQIVAVILEVLLVEVLCVNVEVGLLFSFDDSVVVILHPLFHLFVVLFDNAQILVEAFELQMVILDQDEVS